MLFLFDYNWIYEIVSWVALFYACLLTGAIIFTVIYHWHHDKWNHIVKLGLSHGCLVWVTATGIFNHVPFYFNSPFRLGAVAFSYIMTFFGVLNMLRRRQEVKDEYTKRQEEKDDSTVTI